MLNFKSSLKNFWIISLSLHRLKCTSLSFISRGGFGIFVREGHPFKASASLHGSSWAVPPVGSRGKAPGRRLGGEAP